MTVLPVIFDPLFARLFKSDGLFINQDSTKYSIKKLTTIEKKGDQLITDEYFTYSEGIQAKFPGYKLDPQNIVVNVNDFEINLE